MRLASEGGVGFGEAQAFRLLRLRKRVRQFLYGLVPRLFPREIYGADWLRLD
jgi:hypothetical protein